MDYASFREKVRITGTLIFETAFHIGSGKEGDLATDMGVMKDHQGLPVLPGSTLKGCFRATAERMAQYLNLSACMLDAELSGRDCVSDQAYYRKVHEEFRKCASEKAKLEWLSTHVCDVCKLFGSPAQASRIFFSDGRLIRWSGAYQVRDGVAIDRDSGTARDRLKYDFEVSPVDTAFEIVIELDNPEGRETALVAAVIAEWKSGFRLGGFTSRGLGRAVLTNVKTERVDYTDQAQLKDYLLNGRMVPAENLLDVALQGVIAA